MASVEGHVYVVTNTVNGKKYVGQTTRDVSKRWKRHVEDSVKQSYKSRLHRAIQKYGADKFTTEVRSTCTGRKALDMAERFYIALYQTQNPEFGYNIAAGGQSGSGYRVQRERQVTFTKDDITQHIKDGLNLREIATRYNSGTTVVRKYIAKDFGKGVKELRTELLGCKTPPSFSSNQSRNRTGLQHTDETRRKQAEAAKKSYTPELREIRRQQKLSYWAAKREATAA